MSSRSGPVVSVVIPVRNGGRYIGTALQSALRQTADLEIVVADNASTDDTVRVARAFDDERVRVLESPVDVGAGANWNRAILEAQGRYVKLLCADDALEPTCLERQLAPFEARGGERLALVCGRRRVVDADGVFIMNRGFRAGIRGRVESGRAARLVTRSGSNPIGEPAAVLFRREDAVRAGLFRAAAGYAIDLDLWLRLLLCGDLFVIDEVLADFRVSAGAWSTRVAGTQASEFCNMVRAAAADGRLGLRPGDVFVGCLAARGAALARRGLYWWLRSRERANGI